MAVLLWVAPHLHTLQTCLFLCHCGCCCLCCTILYREASCTATHRVIAARVVLLLCCSGFWGWRLQVHCCQTCVLRQSQGWAPVDPRPATPRGFRYTCELLWWCRQSIKCGSGRRCQALSAPVWDLLHLQASALVPAEQQRRRWQEGSAVEALPATMWLLLSLQAAVPAPAGQQQRRRRRRR